MNRWIREVVIQRLVTLIVCEENERYRALYNSYLDKLMKDSD